MEWKKADVKDLPAGRDVYFSAATEDGQTKSVEIHYTSQRGRAVHVRFSADYGMRISLPKVELTEVWVVTGEYEGATIKKEFPEDQYAAENFKVDMESKLPTFKCTVKKVHKRPEGMRGHE